MGFLLVQVVCFGEVFNLVNCLYVYSVDYQLKYVFESGGLLQLLFGVCIVVDLFGDEYSCWVFVFFYFYGECVVVNWDDVLQWCLIDICWYVCWIVDVMDLFVFVVM